MASSTSQSVRPSDREKLTTEEQELYDMNAASSPLLRLPPEIRTSIYTLVLGERDIHIGQYIRTQNQKIPLHSVCEYAVRTRDLANSIIKDGTEIGHGNWAGVHHRCFFRFGAPYTSLQLQLLGVCRQIHQEASLIPFASNTFIFLDGPAMTTLAGKLSAEQRAGLANMCLTMSPGSTEMFRVPDKKHVEEFTGLKNLTIFGWIPVRGLITAWAEDLVRKTFEGTKDALQAVSWESAVVCLTSVSKLDMFDGPVLEDGHFRSESRELEMALLRTGADGTGAKDSDEGKDGKEDASVSSRAEGDIGGDAKGRGVIDGDAAAGRVEEESAVSVEKTGEEKSRGESEGRETFRERRGLRKLKSRE